MFRVRSAVAVLLAATLILAACGSDKKSTTSSNASSSNAPLTASFRGVTATTIKIGFAVVDFKCLEQFVDNTQGDDEKIIKVFVDDINKNGGILGRQLTYVFKRLCPLDQANTAKVCTEFTDDEQVFAVLGVYDTEPPGDGTNKLCLSRDKETIQINHILREAVINEAKPGLLLTPDIAAERNLDAILSLLKQENKLAGKKVALMADQNSQAGSEPLVKSFASDAGLQMGSTAVLTITSEETT
ncbi:MAG: branched-chain amino acid transport system substrate-binding protein, partial [Acidimicrobiaceae bacterium]